MSKIRSRRRRNSRCWSRGGGCGATAPSLNMKTAPSWRGIENGHGQTAAWRIAMADQWHLSGDYFENCNCSVVCPCLVSKAPPIYTPSALVLLVSPSLRQSGELFRVTMGFYQRLKGVVPLKMESALRAEFENGSRIVSLPTPKRPRADFPRRR